jgi:hypothetical protein
MIGGCPVDCHRIVRLARPSRRIRLVREDRGDLDAAVEDTRLADLTKATFGETEALQ